MEEVHGFLKNKATKSHHWASTHSDRKNGHCNAANLPCFGSSQVPEMA
jgi:hypothetical protein